MHDDHLPLTLSVLDRLLDSADAVSGDRRVMGECADVDGLAKAMGDDLAALLSRYRASPIWPHNLADLDGSILAYRVPEALASSLSTPESRRELVLGLEETIQSGALRLSHLTLSLLDNPTADDPTLRFRLNTPARSHSLSDLKASIRRDLEDLLNTYRRVTGWPESLAELDRSILAYGVPDMLAENLATVDSRRRLVAELEDTIRHWEPRFTHLSVIMLDNTDPADRSLRFRISAEINADPALEPVVFDSVVDPTSNTVLVMRSARG